MSIAHLASPPAARAEDDKLTGDRIAAQGGELIVHPIEHATFVMGWNDTVIYVDPVGGAERFDGLPRPDLILITDIHGDHLNAETVASVSTGETVVVAPKAVADRLQGKVNGKMTLALANGQKAQLEGLPLEVEAVPMYNLTEERRRFHTKGRGNGYLVTIGGKRIYISGDTEDIPEMRKLERIDAAFVCMNLPYTMSVEQAADAVLEFRPKLVYPYHYRGGGRKFSDLNRFQKLLGKDRSIEVRRLEWYGGAE